MSIERFLRFKEAYKIMAKIYRPLAPSDGFGHIQLSERELANPDRLDQEASDFARDFYEKDDARHFVVAGCTGFACNRTIVFLLSAAQCTCAGTRGREIALKLARLAVRDLEGKLPSTIEPG